MRKLIFAVAAVGAFSWSGAAWAVLKETKAADDGNSIPGATITVAPKRSDSSPRPKQKPQQTGRKSVPARPPPAAGPAPGDAAVRALIGIGVGVAVGRALSRGSERENARDRHSVRDRH